MRRAPPLLFALLAGCGGTNGLWRAGVSRTEDGPPGRLVAPHEVAIRLKTSFGAWDETETRRSYMAGTTAVLRKAFLLAPEPGEVGLPEGEWRVLGQVTTEEFPRDEARSRIHGEQVFTLLGLGNDPWELFEGTLDPAFRPEALDRLRELAAAIGADAVVDVFATCEAEHHMFHGSMASLDLSSSWSPLYTKMQLLDFRLRDVRLHGTAVRRE